MARRKKSSPLDDVLDLLAMLPWWVCLVLAAGAISATTQGILVQALNSTPLPSTGTTAQIELAQRRRVCAAIFMVMACPEYLVQK